MDIASASPGQSPHVRRKSVLPGEHILYHISDNVAHSFLLFPYVVDPTVIQGLQAHRSLDEMRAHGQTIGL